jgi:hypothetical protein
VVVETTNNQQFLSSDEETLEKAQGKATDNMMRIIQGNVIPFIVDKFNDMEGQTSKRLKKMQETIRQQNTQILCLQK